MRKDLAHLTVTTKPYRKSMLGLKQFEEILDTEVFVEKRVSKVIV